MTNCHVHKSVHGYLKTKLYLVENISLKEKGLFNIRPQKKYAAGNVQPASKPKIGYSCS